jgi:hypothetical protein
MFDDFAQDDTYQDYDEHHHHDHHHHQEETEEQRQQSERFLTYLIGEEGEDRELSQ